MEIGKILIKMVTNVFAKNKKPCQPVYPYSVLHLTFIDDGWTLGFLIFYGGAKYSLDSYLL